MVVQSKHLVIPIKIQYEVEVENNGSFKGQNDNLNSPLAKRRRFPNDKWPEKNTKSVHPLRTRRIPIRQGSVETVTTTELKEFHNNDEPKIFRTIQVNKKHEDQDQISQGQKVAKKISLGASKKSDEAVDDTPSGKDFATEALKSHNKYRKKHGAAPLKLNSKLTQYAQEWANQLARTNNFSHRQNTPYGENLYCKWSSNPNCQMSGEEPVDSWYAESSKHNDYKREPVSLGTGHFTQVVWKDSKELGIAKAKTSGGKFIVVSNYDPPGNVCGKYVANVMPPQ